MNEANSFLHAVARDIREKKFALDQLIVIVPSERMVTYFQKALFEVEGKPILSPKIYTIDVWLKKLVNKPVLDRVPLLLELYKIYQANPVEFETATFENFLKWGQLLISDFEEIDRYLVQPSFLFRNLREIREIESWSFDTTEELSEGQKRFLAFWEKLGPYYQELKSRLQEQKATTKGGIYRTVAENIDLVFENDKKAHFVFAGFNALSEAELSIFKQLYILGRANIYVDSDEFYLKDKQHEAGYFQRILLDYLQVKELPFVTNTLQNKELKMDVVICGQITAQAGAIGAKLAELSLAQLSETLILLADESLLGTLLQHLPKSIQQANITLGLPLKNTVLTPWIELVFRIQESYERRKTANLYYKDFLHFIHHPFVLELINEQEKEELRQIENRIIKENWHFIFLKDLKISEGNLKNLLNCITEPWNNEPVKIITQIELMVQLIDANISEKAEVEQAVLRSFYKAIQPFKALIEKGLPPISLTSFKSLFQQQWSSATVAYFGNPINGLQIMGLLETRGLDFKHIFVLGLNEGIMPPTNPIQSFIPMDLRKYYGLPTPRDKQGLFAHHIYRLLHKAETVFITYCSSESGMGKEPSRFIQQFKLELAVQNPNFKYTEYVYELDKTENVSPIVVPKNEAIFKRIDELLKEGLTYSKLNTYLECPLNFYYRYVLKIGEEDRFEGEMESGTLGTILHHVLENIYKEQQIEDPNKSQTERKPYQITSDFIKDAKKKIPLLVAKAFEEIYSKDQLLIQTGTNHVNFKMAEDIISRVLSRELAILNEDPDSAMYIVGLEKELEHETEFQIQGAKKEVRIHGILDRIDLFNGQLRVLDYKLGKVESSHVSVKDDVLSKKLSKINQNASSDKYHGLQLLVYSYLIKKAWNRDLDKTGIFSMRSISESPFYLENKTERNAIEIVEEFIQAILDSIYNENIPFKHNTEAHYCQFCGLTKEKSW
ncbi:MAG: PD-(D/E)XK nuclease family protein [Fluviicola sp.]